MQILHRHDDGSFKAAIRIFDQEGVIGGRLFQKRDYEEHLEEIQKRARAGVLRGEMGSPVVQPGMPAEFRHMRYWSIHEDMVCCSFSDVAIERILDLGDQGKGKFDLVEPTVYEAITATVTPSGICKTVFDDVLKNPDLYGFSARASNRGWLHNGPRIGKFITWDLVPSSHLPSVARRNVAGLETV